MVEAHRRVEQDGPAEHDAPVRVPFLREVVVGAGRFAPGGVALDGRRHEPEEPPEAGVRFRHASHGHDRLDETGVHQGPEVALDGTHGDPRGEPQAAHLEVVPQQPVVGLDAIEEAVGREREPETVARLARTPQAEGVGEDHVVSVRVDQLPGSHDGAAAEVVPALAAVPVEVHQARVARVEGAEEDGVVDEPVGVPAGRADGDAGRAQGPCAQGFEGHAAAAPRLPRCGVVEVVGAPDPEARDVMKALEVRQALHPAEGGDGLVFVVGRNPVHVPRNAVCQVLTALGTKYGARQPGIYVRKQLSAPCDTRITSNTSASPPERLMTPRHRASPRTASS
ncbi:MAG: hypothetical protein A4E67_00139 [Syntrophaceae bacterium PtaB.Bin038]|nr:MAG: hypothetical protein A4E67_00139 [Syntrophaceae bacterium PtaB.Bin038]